jgi:hypothetical protein
MSQFRNSNSAICRCRLAAPDSLQDLNDRHETSPTIRNTALQGCTLLLSGRSIPRGGYGALLAGPLAPVQGSHSAITLRYPTHTFSGALQQQIQQVIRESSKTQFATYLAAQSSSFQSVALSVTDQPSDVEARLRVEYVYANRNEVRPFIQRRATGTGRLLASLGQIRSRL